MLAESSASPQDYNVVHFRKTPPKLNFKSDRAKSEYTQAKLLLRLTGDTALALRNDLEKARSPADRMRLIRSLKEAMVAWNAAREACKALRDEKWPKHKYANNGAIKKPGMTDEWHGPPAPPAPPAAAQDAQPAVKPRLGRPPKGKPTSTEASGPTEHTVAPGQHENEPTEQNQMGCTGGEAKSHVTRTGDKEAETDKESTLPPEGVSTGRGGEGQQDGRVMNEGRPLGASQKVGSAAEVPEGSAGVVWQEGSGVGLGGGTFGVG